MSDVIDFNLPVITVLGVNVNSAVLGKWLSFLPFDMGDAYSLGSER